jgi:hypothetical protein
MQNDKTSREPPNTILYLFVRSNLSNVTARRPCSFGEAKVVYKGDVLLVVALSGDPLNCVFIESVDLGWSCGEAPKLPLSLFVGDAPRLPRCRTRGKSAALLSFDGLDRINEGMAGKQLS